MKRFLSVILVFSMVMTVLPLHITAVEGEFASRPCLGASDDVIESDVLLDDHYGEKIAVSVELNSYPKQNYWVGEALDVSEGSLLVRYDDGTSSVIPLSLEMVSGFSSDESGVYVLTVSYGEFEITYEAEVFENSVLSLELLSDFTKKVYLEGETLDPSGARIAVCYENGDRVEMEVLSSMIFGFRSDMTGMQDVLISYGGVDIYTTVQVKAKSVVRISIATMPTKTVYAIGEVLNLNGGELLVEYNNATKKTIPLTPFMISGFRPTSAGILDLTVTYEGVKTTFSVTVVSVLLGDLTFDEVVDQKDAVYLLYHLFVPNEFPLNQKADYNLDGVVSDRDVLAVLRGEMKDQDDEEGDGGGGNNGGLVDGPGIGTEVPPVGDFPFNSQSPSRVGGSVLTAELASTEIHRGAETEVTLSFASSVKFSSAYFAFSVDSGLEVANASWLEGGVLSDINGSRAAMVKEASAVSDQIFKLTLRGCEVSAGNLVSITAVFCDTKGNVVATENIEFSVSVCEIPFRHGDINWDGSINGDDYTLLLRYLNGWDQEIKSPEAMDVNVDGIVDTLDGLLLLKYVNGRDVHLGNEV